MSIAVLLSGICEIILKLIPLFILLKIYLTKYAQSYFYLICSDKVLIKLLTYSFSNDTILEIFLEGSHYVFYHHSTQTMTLVSVAGTGLFCCVPERMMKRKTSFCYTVDGTQLLTVIFIFGGYHNENESIIIE